MTKKDKLLADILGDFSEIASVTNWEVQRDFFQVILDHMDSPPVEDAEELADFEST